MPSWTAPAPSGRPCGSTAWRRAGGGCCWRGCSASRWGRTLVWPAISALVLLGLAGLASLAFGIVLLVQPGAGAVAVVWLIGAYAIVFGVLLLTLGWRLRRWERAGGGNMAGLGTGWG